MNHTQFKELLDAACAGHSWLASNFSAPRRRSVVDELAQECQFQIQHRNMIDAQAIGKIAADTVGCDATMIPVHLSGPSYINLAAFVARWMLDHPEARNG